MFFCARNLLLLELPESKHSVVETFLESGFSLKMLLLRVMIKKCEEFSGPFSSVHVECVLYLMFFW